MPEFTPGPPQDTRQHPPGDKYGVAGVSYPTPNVDDIIIIEEKPISVPSYRPLPYNTPHPVVERAKLVYQAIVKGNGLEKNARRIYATDRVAQDAYNYAVTFESDLGFPAVIRNYVLLREDYDPLPDFDLDPEFTSAVLTKEEMRPVEDQQLTSLFVRVTRVYEVLPGLWKETTRADEEYGPVKVKRRSVRYNSANEGVSGANSRTSFAPRDESGIVSIETVETWGTTPTRAGQEVDRETGIARGYTLHLETFDAGGSPPSLGSPNKTITPHGPQAAEVREDLSTALASALLALPMTSRPIKVRLRIPDELTSALAVFNETKGTGASAATGEGASVGTSWSVSLSLPSRSSSSLSVIPDLPLAIRSFDGDDVPATEYAFFIAINSTLDQIIAKLASAPYLNTAVNKWPSFKTETLSFSLHGKQVSISASASAHQSASASDANTSFSKGTETGSSVETGGSVRTIQVSRTLHREITIANAIKTSTVSVTAATGWPMSTNFPALSATSSPAAVTALALITPSHIDATDPPAVPVAELYLSGYNVQGYTPTVVKVFCEVVDMDYFLSAPRGFVYVYSSPPDTNYPTGVAIATNSPTPGTGGAAVSYAVSPALPTGLSLNTSTGAITGTPTVITALATYTVTATNTKGTGTVTLTIQVH